MNDLTKITVDYALARELIVMGLSCNTVPALDGLTRHWQIRLDSIHC